MTAPRFIQIHSLVSYSAALLNRDDSGFAKRLPFGGAIRTRISSQSLKRHWRMAEDEWSLASIGLDMAVRSRKIPEERILKALEASGAGTPETRKAVTDVLILKIYGNTNIVDAAKAKALLSGDLSKRVGHSFVFRPV